MMWRHPFDDKREYPIWLPWLCIVVGIVVGLMIDLLLNNLLD